MPKLVRITTVPVSLMVLLKGQMKFMNENEFEVTMISSPGEEVPKLIEQEKCAHIPVMLTRKITPIQDLKSLIQFLTLELGRKIYWSTKPKQTSQLFEAKKPGRGFIAEAINAA